MAIIKNISIIENVNIAINRLVVTIAEDPPLVSLKINNSKNAIIADIKNPTVAISSLSIYFLSVFNSLRAIIILEFENEGINENIAKNNAVAIDENDTMPFIISV
ncbi:hypothetical protein [Latilactobacillus sakei]|uniref:Uncharacterized protein n=1 Tax=Latilactobacillus sakei TaxID=1599 RepID=A0AAF0GU65_LATSK|nr:hypothetical protein [Latilactobacillus sakei]WGI19902.1 hypothetical protein QBD03_04115 [Latilactobacillus sakei]